MATAVSCPTFIWSRASNKNAPDFLRGKTFLQGLIQVAAAFHHFQRGNCAGTISLLRSGLRRLDGFQETFGGIDVAPLRTSVRLWLETLETVPQSPAPPHPQLQLA